MNHIDLEGVVQKINDMVLNNPIGDSSWIKNYSTKIICNDQSITVDHKYKLLSDGYYLNVTSSVIESSMENLDYIFQTNAFKQYNPMIFKYHQIDSTKDSFVFEDEMNLFGFNKTAICFKKTFLERDGIHFYFFSNITHDKSQIIPFRDSHILYTVYIFQPIVSNYVKVIYMTKTDPLPWLHQSDIQNP